MTNDLTIATKVFAMQYSDKTGSLRKETVRGVSLPTTLSIAHQPFTDSKTGRPGIRTKIGVSRYLAMLDGKIEPINVYMVVARPTDVNVSAAEILLASEDLIGLIQEDDVGLNLLSNIVAGEQ